MVRSPGRPAHSIGPLDRVHERLEQGSLRDLRRIKFPEKLWIIAPGLDYRNLFTDPTLAAWPSANRAIYFPFPVDSEIVTVLGGTIVTGINAATHNVDIGIYDSIGTRLMSTGSTAMTNSNASAFLGDVVLQEGKYYLGIACDSASPQVLSYATTALGSNINCFTAVDIHQEAGAFPLPAVAGFNPPTSSYLPVLSLYIANRFGN